MRRCRMKSPAATPKTEIAPARNKVAGRMPPVSDGLSERVLL
jgi:hypothetical protein